MAESRTKGGFHCDGCDRSFPAQRASRYATIRSGRPSAPLCKQCASFYDQKLFHLQERLRAKCIEVRPADELTDPPVERAVQITTAPAAGRPRELNQAGVDRIEKPQKKGKKGRSASRIEKEAFAFQCQALERYIEGFVQGLEAAGIDRKQLNRESIRAIDAMLGICQATRSQRLSATNKPISRSEIRKLARHLKDAALLADEYLRAVKESVAPKTRPSSSLRYSSPRGTQ